MDMANFNCSNLIWRESICRSCVCHVYDGGGWHCNYRNLEGRDALPVGEDCKHYVGTVGTEKGGKESYICTGVEFGVQVYMEDMRDWMLIAVPRDYSVMQVQEITGEDEPDDRTICEKLVEAWRVSDPSRRYRVCVRGVTRWGEIAGGAK